MRETPDPFADAIVFDIILSATSLLARILSYATPVCSRTSWRQAMRAEVAGAGVVCVGIEVMASPHDTEVLYYISSGDITHTHYLAEADTIRDAVTPPYTTS